MVLVYHFSPVLQLIYIVSIFKHNFAPKESQNSICHESNGAGCVRNPGRLKCLRTRHKERRIFYESLC